MQTKREFVVFDILLQLNEHGFTRDSIATIFRQHIFSFNLKMSQGGRRDLIPIRSEALPSHQLHCLHGFLADALEMHIEPFSSMRYCLSCLVLKHISTALLSFGVFSFHTTITIIYFHTLKHTHITKGNLQRSEAHLSSCSL